MTTIIYSSRPQDGILMHHKGAAGVQKKADTDTIQETAFSSAQWTLSRGIGYTLWVKTQDFINLIIISSIYKDFTDIDDPSFTKTRKNLIPELLMYRNLRKL